MAHQSNLRCRHCGSHNLTRNGNVAKSGGGHRHAKQRWLCKNCHRENHSPVGLGAADNIGIDQDAANKRAAGIGKRLVITAAQNATPVHKGFWAALKSYCQFTGAELLVIPYRYKNPTSIWSEEAKNDDWWASETVKHLVNTRIELNKHLVLLADIKTQPTATSPLNGFETISGQRSAIIGHAKLALKTVPTPQASLPKILTTTGTCTEPNYVEGKAGKKGEFHHTFGACVVELDGDRFHMRQINALKDGSFCDLNYEFFPSKKPTYAPAAGLVLGDAHIEFIDPQAVDATFTSPHSMVNVLNPAQIVWHDVHDFYSRNHHHRGKVFINYVKYHTGLDNVEKWLDHTFEFIDKVTAPNARNVFVASNHHDALARWIEETDPRTDPENCLFWAKTFEAMCAGAKLRETGAHTIDPFAYWGKKKLKTKKQTKFLARGESYTILGIEVAYHGDRGSNGARGSLRSFSTVGVKTITGHSHSPGIQDGAYAVGMMARYGMEYTRGTPSSHLQTNCVIYRNGKRSLLNIVDGEWHVPTAA